MVTFIFSQIEELWIRRKSLTSGLLPLFHLKWHHQVSEKPVSCFLYIFSPYTLSHLSMSTGVQQNLLDDWLTEYFYKATCNILFWFTDRSILHWSPTNLRGWADWQHNAMGKRTRGEAREPQMPPYWADESLCASVPGEVQRQHLPPPCLVRLFWGLQVMLTRCLELWKVLETNTDGIPIPLNTGNPRPFPEERAGYCLCCF